MSRLCTLQESQARKNVVRLEGTGQNRFGALENLTQLCHRVNLATAPKLVSLGSCKEVPAWHCGTFKVYKNTNTNNPGNLFRKLFTPKITVYNTVFWVELDNLVMCYVYV